MPPTWRQWTELTIALSGLPSDVQTFDLYNFFEHEGNISRIDIKEEKGGARSGCGTITFCPPPGRPLWQAKGCVIDISHSSAMINIALEPPKRTFGHPSPVRNFTYPERIELTANSLRFGFMSEEDKMMVMHSIETDQVSKAAECRTQFVLNLLRRQIEIYFNLGVPDLQRYKIEIPLAQLDVCWENQDVAGHFVLTITLNGPPNCYRKMNNIESTHQPHNRHWTQRWAWFRQTEITLDRSTPERSPTTLVRGGLAIDIGRWRTYRLTFDNTSKTAYQLTLVKQALGDYNIRLLAHQRLQLVPRRESMMWKWAPSIPLESGLRDLQTKLFSLPFAVRYQLEVCLSQDRLNETNITKDFVQNLAEMEEQRAINLLEYVAEKEERIFEPLRIFEFKAPQQNSARKVPGYLCRVRSVIVTPSTMKFITPMLETTNRVIRQFIEHADRFLRVRFADEDFQERINSQDGHTFNAIFTRIKCTMANGILVGDRHFEFLAYGNSQLREHGAYFFASTSQITTNHIRLWMGDFRPIKVIAKYAARIGQCFSTTRAINSVGNITIKEMADVERNGYNFTDGVGKISKFLAQMVATELQIPGGSGNPPSLFQFRLGGCKGVLALSPDLRAKEIGVRKSQYKFAATHNGLEVIRCSSFATATLNCQLIMILSTLGVPDEVFMKKVMVMLVGLEKAMTDHEEALKQLSKSIDANQMSLTIVELILDGFMDTKEPFTMSLLHLWRCWTLKYLKEKARITIDKGACLLGCTDETGTLQGHFDDFMSQSGGTFEEHTRRLPEIFLQISCPLQKGLYNVVEGICIVGRNPSLHPGDIRIVRAVNNPQLSHLKDVVVFPQTGDRDLPSMCSGGDLDGDDFFVIWDLDLIPPIWDHPAMDHTAPQPVEAIGEITVDDMTSFFVNFMKNDKLGKIATSWLANADWLNERAQHPKCLKLAMLHSVAVDYPKSGVPATVQQSLVPHRYPHFMKSKYRPKEKTYHSDGILGQIYDQVDDFEFSPSFHLPFDERILNAYTLTAETLEDAKALKQDYDIAMRRTMAHHEINSDIEVWSSFVLSHSSFRKKYDFHEEIGRLSNGLQNQFRQLCYDRVGGKDFNSIAPFVAAMYAVTAREVNEKYESFLKRRHDQQGDVEIRMTAKEQPLITFPWIFQKELAPSSPTAQAQMKEKGFVLEFSRGNNVKIAEGVTHRGELLELFSEPARQDKALEPDSDGDINQVHIKMVASGFLALQNTQIQPFTESSTRFEPLSLINPHEDCTVHSTDEDLEIEDGELLKLEIHDKQSSLESLANLLSFEIAA